MQKQLDLFDADRLPRRPYCTNHLPDGIYRRPLVEALLHRYVQPNPESLMFWLCFDLDRPAAAVDWQDGRTPAPNVVIANPANGHAHLLYALDVAVCHTDAGSQKAIRYAAAVEYALRKQLRADDGYVRLVIKNPLHEQWRTWWVHQHRYSLGELADWLNLPPRLPKRAREVGLGRNITLFDAVRVQFYKQVREFKATGTKQAFFDAVRFAADARNAEFPDPLPDSEVRALARSIAKWIWSRFDIAASDERFSALQAHRGRMGGKASGETRRGKATNGKAAAEALRAEGMSYRAIAAELGVAVGTVHGWLR